MEQKVFILGYSAYEFTDDKDKVLKGGKISYITESVINDGLKQGLLPVQTPIDFDILLQLNVPCLAKVKYVASTDSKNKLVMKIDSIEVLNDNVDYLQLFKIVK